jgi:steroid 5-alpha reductase family enzyme
MMVELITSGAALVLALMAALWVASVVRRDVSIVDPWWSIAFLVVAANGAWRTESSPGKLLVLTAVAIWAVRLWAHLLWRSRNAPEDPRYAAFRQRFGPERYWWVSLFQVFLLQGVLALLISAPLLVSMASDTPDPVSWSDAVGLVLFVFGFALESIADWQLHRFRTNPRRKGVLDTGLWAWSRHPNYFGEAVIAWSFWLFALDQPWGPATVFAPIAMTYLLLRVSGVSMLDAHMRATRPEYAAYIDRTPAFVPRSPRPRTTHGNECKT